VIAVIGDMRSPTLDDIDYDRATLYAERDADCQIRITPKLWAKIEAMDLQEISRIDHAILPMLDRMQHVGIKLAPTGFWDGIERECEDQMNRSQYKIFEITGRDLNPASGDQVADLLYGDKASGGLGLIPPKMTESYSRGAVDAVCLESLLSENPVVQHIMDYTEANKIRGTYVDPLRKLCTQGDGRTRSTIRSTRTTTGRLSMADPPLHQIPILSEIGKKLRAGFVAEDGNILGDWDVDQLEARVCAHDSRDPELCRLFNEGRDVHAETACRMFSVPMSVLSVGPTGKINDYRRSIAKHCVAEGQMVLTDQGLVPIERITLQHKLWDGVEWVSHDGVIDQGIREVIEYDGLTLTPDHQVVTEGGRITTFGEAALSLVRLHKTGDGRQAIRTRYRNLIEDSARERVYRAACEMYEVRAGELATEGQSYQEGCRGVQVMQLDKIQTPARSRSPLRCHLSALQHLTLSELQKLWGTRHQVPVQVAGRVCVLGGEESSAQGLSGYHDWPYRQQRSLRAGEPAVGDDAGTAVESAQHDLGGVSGKARVAARLRQSILSELDTENGVCWHERRGDHQERHQTGFALQGTGTGAAVAKRSRVYDILNAGPRLCFTACNSLILNCFFGIINGITEHGLVNYMILNRAKRPNGEPWTLDDCVMFIKAWFDIYKGVKRFHQDCIRETQATGLTRESIGGRVLFLPQIWSENKKVRETAERMSYVMYTQGGGQTIIKKAMAVAWKYICQCRDFKAQPLLQMHDELLLEMPNVGWIKESVDAMMIQILCGTTKLRVPMKASGGYGPNWLDAH
jgi:DNA polymerase I-like protein with 3'-5' exonuclease and polymerase domains